MGRLEECDDFKKTVFNSEVGREIFASVVVHSILLIFLIVNIGVGEAPLLFLCCFYCCIKVGHWRQVWQKVIEVVG